MGKVSTSLHNGKYFMVLKYRNTVLLDCINICCLYNYILLTIIYIYIYNQIL